MRHLALGLVACALLAGCGKKGDPEPPGPEQRVTYPRTYPREEGAPEPLFRFPTPVPVGTPGLPPR